MLLMSGVGTTSGLPVMYTAVPRTRISPGSSPAMKAGDGGLAAVELVPEHAPAAAPGDHQIGEGGRHHEREPAAGGDLERVGGEVSEVDRQKAAEHECRSRPPAPAPGGDQANLVDKI